MLKILRIYGMVYHFMVNALCFTFSYLSFSSCERGLNQFFFIGNPSFSQHNPTQLKTQKLKIFLDFSNFFKFLGIFFKFLKITSRNLSTLAIWKFNDANKYFMMIFIHKIQPSTSIEDIFPEAKTSTHKTNNTQFSN